MQQIQREYLSLSTKSCYGTHQNFKTTRGPDGEKENILPFMSILPVTR